VSPTVSVALATHNGASFLGRQLASILAQSHPVDEIVLSDDASADATVELAERSIAASRAADAATPALVVLRNPVALGVTANFEQALRAATGDVVILCDQDDVWHPDRVSAALAALDQADEVDLVAADARLVDAAGDPIGRTLFETLGVDSGVRARLQSGAAFEELLRRNVVTGATVAVTRGLIDRATPFPTAWVHDEWLAMVAAVRGGIALVERPLLDYRQHGSNQIGVSRLSLRGRFSRLAEPRTRRNARLLERAAQLADRLPALTDDPRIAAAARAKLAHEEFRRDLPRPRIRRLAPVVRAWRSGAYRQFGLGAQDALRDAVQPV
jgi:glycosyltransferase involved in cell wall biosynthesis